LSAGYLFSIIIIARSNLPQADDTEETEIASLALAMFPLFSVTARPKAAAVSSY